VGVDAPFGVGTVTDGGTSDVEKPGGVEEGSEMLAEEVSFVVPTVDGTADAGGRFCSGRFCSGRFCSGRFCSGRFCSGRFFSAAGTRAGGAGAGGGDIGAD